MPSKLQSAMEYLMTYGWAILIIAVVLGALFQLGIFNASTFTPKAPPGACHVFRPNGPNTVSFINLQGICNGELPQYAAQFSGSSTISIAKLTGMQALSYGGSSKITIVAWANPSIIAAYYTIASYNAGAQPSMEFGPDSGCSGNYYLDVIYATSISYESACLYGSLVPTNQYSFFVFGFDGTHIIQYAGINGHLYTNTVSATLAFSIPAASPFMIGGSAGSGGSNWKGQISNVQIYNTTLSSNEITALYNGGIGAAPVQLNNLVGWWPLNGDTKDYSGNNNNGVPSGVTFTSNWESGYSAP